jgi:hypothetical protein
MFFRIISFILTIFLIMPNSINACEWKTDYVSISSPAKDIKNFEKISRKMTLKKIIQKLGPANRDLGSGVHVLEWDISDGRVFRISVVGACDKPMALGFHEKK